MAAAFRRHFSLDLARLEKMQIGAAGGKIRQVARGGLALRACEGGLDIGDAVEGQDRNQMQSGRPGRRADGALADLRRLVQHDEFGHDFLPVWRIDVSRSALAKVPYSAGFAASPRKP